MAHTDRKQSSLIKAAVRSGSDLVVEFNSGRQYRYTAAGDHAERLNAAPSKGRYFLEHVRSKYSFRQEGSTA